ncbi:hypothetical protein KEG25_01255 [Bacillus paralicheniformis]|uniref:hypothetical protein n=1 Tax=Bacillus paralicheniformis TaxID=1648923 RepID=UPI001B953D95|nr:hypothetical protein [Bacillus paralicheniformis]MBR8662064.1 hypothetical protein [Bacillus paralicheniformis]
MTLKLRGKIQDDFDGKIEVYKDDELIDNNAGTTFVDDEVEFGKTYVYKFVVLKKLSSAEIEKVNEAYEKRNQKLSFDQFKDYYYRPYEYIKAIKMPEQKECELGKVQCELDELDCLEKAAFICHDMSALKIRLDFLEKIHSNKRKNKVNPNDNLKLSLSILPIEHKMLLYK